MEIVGGVLFLVLSRGLLSSFGSNVWMVGLSLVVAFFCIRYDVDVVAVLTLAGTILLGVADLCYPRSLDELDVSCDETGMDDEAVVDLNLDDDDTA